MARYFDDFSVGERFSSESAAISEEEIVVFAQRYDPQPFHIDLEAANASPYGGLIASGFHTLSFGFRLFIDTGALADCGMGSPGVEAIRWLAPVRPGDILRTEAEVAAMRPSGSDPGRGVLTMDFTVFNQDDTAVLTMRSVVLVRRQAGE